MFIYRTIFLFPLVSGLINSQIAESLRDNFASLVAKLRTLYSRPYLGEYNKGSAIGLFTLIFRPYFMYPETNVSNV